MIKRDAIAERGDKKIQEAIASFEREMANMCKIKSHPNIVQL